MPFSSMNHFKRILFFAIVEFFSTEVQKGNNYKLPPLTPFPYHTSKDNSITLKSRKIKNRPHWVHLNII